MFIFNKKGNLLFLAGKKYAWLADFIKDFPNLSSWSLLGQAVPFVLLLCFVWSQGCLEVKPLSEV